MNQTQRVKLVREVLRIANVANRGHGSLEDNVRVNKEAIDSILRTIALKAIPRNKLRRRPRIWADLRPQDKERIVNKLARKCLRRGTRHHCHHRSQRMGFIDTIAELRDQVEDRMRTLQRTYPSRIADNFWTIDRGGRLPKEGTPTTRLDTMRRSLLNTWRFETGTGYRNPIKLLEFCTYIHPDDVEWQRYEGDPDIDKAEFVYRVVCSREVLKLSKLFPGLRPLAANLYLEDEKTKSRVYYAAFLEMPPKKCPYVRTAFIARARLPRQGTSMADYTTTALYKTPAGALKAANDIYGLHMAQFLYKEAAQ